MFFQDAPANAAFLKKRWHPKTSIIFPSMLSDAFFRGVFFHRGMTIGPHRSALRVFVPYLQ
ncbi:hypothetical protein NJLHNGOC_00055 [Novacetimonas cocois]|uniref:Uncharacterized protein n=1 Tax=Novacetimonas cocois TaxID=1747507 RepID=A0A365Z0I9_9PROT|nr:hypothetical protein NJLHNGOC_00055 [Novacetimonas cocois]